MAARVVRTPAHASGFPAARPGPALPYVASARKVSATAEERFSIPSLA